MSNANDLYTKTILEAMVCLVSGDVEYLIKAVEGLLRNPRCVMSLLVEFVLALAPTPRLHLIEVLVHNAPLSQSALNNMAHVIRTGSFTVRTLTEKQTELLALINKMLYQHVMTLIAQNCAEEGAAAAPAASAAEASAAPAAEASAASTSATDAPAAASAAAPAAAEASEASEKAFDTFRFNMNLRNTAMARGEQRR